MARQYATPRDALVRARADRQGATFSPPSLLRHTSATQYLVRGGDVISLQQKLGHAGLEMTNPYVHFAAQQLAPIQERVAPMDKLDIRPMRVPRR